MVAVKKDKVSGDSLGTGRRKSAVARVRVRSGSGNILINRRPLDEYFVNDQDRKTVREVLDVVEQSGAVDVIIRVTGGGATGQAGACRMGIARALVGHNEELFPALRDGGFLTRGRPHEGTQEVRSPRCSSRDAVLETLTTLFVTAPRDAAWATAQPSAALRTGSPCGTCA